MVVRLYRELTNGREECLSIEASEPLTEQEIARITWLFGETFTPAHVRLDPFIVSDRVVEIGPRLAVETAFSSNAVSICHAMGVSKVTRIELSRRYELSDVMTEDSVVTAHLDRMTQVVYQKPHTTFGSGLIPQPVRIIPLLERGAAALRELNAELGLGMDEWDVAFYTDLFIRSGRNPTDVELFQIGNANSEHSRHWFFRGKFMINGHSMPDTLFSIVQAPLKVATSAASILAFRDNAGVILGSSVFAMVSECPGHPAQLILKEGVWHIACTAETHNHPTFVAPYPGAATGSGGRIRDNTAPGRGAIPCAGVAGYCVGNLFLSNHQIPGEMIGGEELAQYASPARILIEGSNGISDYGNQFGEPLIGGFTRTFGLTVNGERREFRKPVLYSGGLSRIQAIHAEKHGPDTGMLVIRIGGPAYRIGVGGGSASSMVQGANTEELDFNSVQRGNAEMENRANRAIRACIEMGDANPIESIHDQGAGGPSNVLTELMEPAGGRIDIRKIILGDQTMSVLEIWGAEYQEGYGILIKRERLAELQAICERERVNCEVVGEITGDGHVTVLDSKDGTVPVRLNLHDILTGIPQKTFQLERVSRRLDPLVLPDDFDLGDTLRQVMCLPQVGSKGFLVRKADRSVTGLVARQQCCGPAQIPVADVSVTADGFFGVTGAAMAIGEQPAKMLLDPAAGARMAVGEMLTNMVSAKISKLEDIRCRANWMWPAKLPGEGALLYDAAVAMRDFMMALGIAVDGGKDSLSLAATIRGETIKSPGELVIFGYARVPDVRNVATPDLKHPGKSLIGFIDLGCGKNRLGGSSLAQTFGQIGNDCPDVGNPVLLGNVFRAVQQLIGRKLITALHDRSDGGLIVSVVEMCLAAYCGATITIGTNSDPRAELFSEELGVAFEYLPEHEAGIRAILGIHRVPFSCLGTTTTKPRFVVKGGEEHRTIFESPIAQLRAWWEATSSRLELDQADASVVEAERSTYGAIACPRYSLSFRPTVTAPDILRSTLQPRVAILREEGTNGDREMAAAFLAAGFAPYDIMMSDLLAGRASLDSFQGLVFPGGFSFMDVMGSGKGWAAVVRFNQDLRAMFERFYGRSDTFSLGVCNGCQLMALLGWVPWKDTQETAQPRFVTNASHRFESRWATVRIVKSPSLFFRGMEGSALGIWVAHGEGRLIFPDAALLTRVLEEHLAPLAFVDPQGMPTEDYPYNPNGSPHGIAALSTPDGRHLAMMPHAERCFLNWQWPWMPEDWKRDLPASPWLRMFQNARAWCLEH